MRKGRPDRVKAQFKKVFPRLGALGVGLAEFRKSRKFIEGYVTEALKRVGLDEVDALDFVTREKEDREELTRYAVEFYKNPTTRSSQISLVRKLATDELNLSNAEIDIEDVPGGGKDVVSDPDKLKPHVRELWRQLPRIKPELAPDDQAREKLELTPNAKIIFKAILATDVKFNTTTATELIVDHYEYLRREVIRRVKRKFKAGVMFSFRSFIHRKLKLKTKRNRPRLSVKQLPALLRKELEIFEKRAGLGIDAFDDLRRLAAEHQFTSTEPLEPETIAVYRSVFLTAAAYFDMPDDIGVRDLMLLEQKKDSREWFNRYVDRYRVREQMVERASKRLHFDSDSYANSVNAICAIARYNGIFDLQEEFRKYHGARLDRRGRKNRKINRKAKMSRRWIDEEIHKLVVRFDEIIKTKSFLVHKSDLELCLFLPQCLTMRVLGYRQQCLRHCDVGKNIFFPKRGSVAFSYETDEIKNEVPISQTLCVAELGKVNLVKLLIEVLEKYKFDFLDVISSLYPVEYQEYMGNAFFGVPNDTEGGCGLRRNRVGDKGNHYLVYQRDETSGRSGIHYFFTKTADRLMDMGHLIGTNFNLNPHFLRAVCVDWMKDDLGMTWEEIEEAIGDKEETLKQHYYNQRARIQNAATAFARISRKNGAEQEKIQDSSIVRDALNSMQESYRTLTAQSVRTEERAARAEQRARVAEERAAMSEERAGCYEKSERYWRAVAAFAMDKAGLSPSDLPSELQLPAAA